MSHSSIVFRPPFTRPALGSNAGDDGEGLLLKGVLIGTVTSLVEVGAFLTDVRHHSEGAL